MRRKTSERNKSKRSPEKSPEKSTRKSHRHSRRRRKSSSSSSEDEKPLNKSAADTKTAEKIEPDVKPAEAVVKADNESDLSAGSSRRSNKKATPPEPEVKVDAEAPPSSENKSNEWKEDKEFWNTSETTKEAPAEEEKDKEGGSMWKVQSANGAGGEIQKLKICRQRPAEAGESGETTKKRSTRSSDGNSSRGTDDSVHEDGGDKDSKKSKHRTRTSSRNSPSVVCDVSESSPTKIKIINMSHLEKKSGDDVSEIPTPAEEVNSTHEILNSDIPLPDDVGKALEKESQPVPSLDEIEVPPEKESKDAVEDSDKAEETTSVSVDLSQIPEPVDEPKKEKTPEVEEKNEVKDVVKEDSEKKSSETNENEKTKPPSDSESRSSSSSDSEKQQKSSRQRSKVKLKRRNTKQSTDSAKVESSDSEEEHTKEEKAKETNGSISKENRPNESPEICETNEGALEQKLPRKRRWGASKTIRPNKKPLVSISTNCLKDLVPGAKPVPAEELQLSAEEEEEGQLDDDDEDDITIINMTEEKIEEKPKELEHVVEEKKKESHREKEKNEEVRRKSEKKEKINKTETVNSNSSNQRRISLLTDDSHKLARSPSPPRRRPSSVLYITNLVRPFTVQQLKNLLLRTGTIAENGFWIDSIKSKCYVEYTTEDAAVETRHALHGVRWPVSNPKTLIVEFSSHDDMVMAQTLAEDSEPIPRKAEPLIVDRSVEGWIADQARLKGDRPARRVMAAVREWDVGKPEHPDEIIEQDLRLKERQREQERRMRKERSHRSATPDTSEIPVRKQRRKEEDAPAKLLDDLFRKTKSSPCIYWLPLTQEQIAVKEEIRRQHMAEHERRVAELKKADQARRDRERRNRK